MGSRSGGLGFRVEGLEAQVSVSMSTPPRPKSWGVTLLIKKQGRSVEARFGVSTDQYRNTQTCEKMLNLAKERVLDWYHAKRQMQRPASNPSILRIKSLFPWHTLPNSRAF